MSETNVEKTPPAAQDVENAFRQAQTELGTTWKLSGRGHCRRATLRGRFSAAAARGADQSFTRLCFSHRNRTRVFPYDIVARAAALLNVELDVILSREVTSGGHAPEATVTVSVSTVPSALPHLHGSTRRRGKA